MLMTVRGEPRISWREPTNYNERSLNNVCHKGGGLFGEEGMDGEIQKSAYLEEVYVSSLTAGLNY